MRSLKWSTSHAVFVTEIDDEHKEIFEAVSKLQKALARGAELSEIRKLTQCLSTCVGEHFAHEERLMRAARYDSLRWHKRKHDAARLRVQVFALRIEQGEAGAAREMVEYLAAWLNEHTRLPDRMLGAFLRNQRCMWRVTFHAGTRPLDACAWVDADGNQFHP